MKKLFAKASGQVRLLSETDKNPKLRSSPTTRWPMFDDEHHHHAACERITDIGDCVLSSNGNAAHEAKVWLGIDPCPRRSVQVVGIVPCCLHAALIFAGLRGLLHPTNVRSSL